MPLILIKAGPGRIAYSCPDTRQPSFHCTGDTMTHLTVEQRQALHQQLTGLVARLRGEIATATGQSPGGETLGLANHRQEVDDEAVANLETGLDIAAVERDMHELRAAERALEQLTDGGYGICADCSAEIPFERLHASPAASRCVTCLSRVERASGKNRPHSL